jgi:fucose permease
MKQWIGRWLIVVAAIHTIFATIVFGDVLLGILKRGVFNTVGTDARTASVVWFVLFGAMLFVGGLAVAALEKSSMPIPKSIGWGLLLICIAGVVLMPASGFWLAFPPAIALLARPDSRNLAALKT